MKEQDKKNSDGRNTCIYGKENGFVESSKFRDKITQEDPGRLHYGADFAAPAGTPIPAALDGEVVFNAFNKGKEDVNKGYGYALILKHRLTEDFVVYTLYAHLAEKSGWMVGSKVKSGDTIGFVGDFPYGSGKNHHLHFEVILRSLLKNDLLQRDDGTIGIRNEDGRIDPKEAACLLKTLKTFGYISVVELCGIDTGEKCMGDHKNPWAVGCVYGVTLGQMAGGFSRAVAAGNWSLDPCAVYCGIWKEVKRLTGEITIFNKLIIKTPAGFFAARGTAFTISVSADLNTCLTVKNGEVEFIPAGRLDALTFTRGAEVTFAGKTGNILQKSSGGRNHADDFLEWTREVAKRRIPSIMPSIVCRQVVEIRPEGSVYCYSRSGSRKLTMSEKTNGAPQNAKEQIMVADAPPTSKKPAVEASAQEQAEMVCDIKADYKGISWNIASIRISGSFRGRNAPEGKEFVAVDLTAENKSSGRVFVFYDEEIKLKTDEGGEIITPDNYWINTDFEPSTLSKGTILFTVPTGQRNFVLSFGKNPDSAVKVPLNIQL